MYKVIIIYVLLQGKKVNKELILFIQKYFLKFCKENEN